MKIANTGSQKLFAAMEIRGSIQNLEKSKLDWRAVQKSKTKPQICLTSWNDSLDNNSLDNDSLN